MEILKPKKYYIAWSNTDLCEGRGNSFIYCASESHSCVSRLGEKKYCMGTDCPIEEHETYIIDGQHYVPYIHMAFHFPDKQDEIQDAKRKKSIEEREKTDAIVSKLKGILSPDEIDFLRKRK